MLKLKQETENFRKGEKGITLIALVITIVLNAVAWSSDGRNQLKYKKTLANNGNLL